MGGCEYGLWPREAAQHSTAQHSDTNCSARCYCWYPSELCCTVLSPTVLQGGCASLRPSWSFHTSPSQSISAVFLVVLSDFRVYLSSYMISLSCPVQSHDQFIMLPIRATWLAYHFPCELHDRPIMFPFPVTRSVYHAPHPSCMVSLSFFHGNYMISLSCSLFQSHDQFIVLPIRSTWLAYHFSMRTK